MAQGVAWMARELDIPATIVAPDNASQAKLAAVERLGGKVVRLPWERWWAAVDADHERDLGEGVDGYFVHPVKDEPVIAGNGTIGLELAEELEAIEAVLVPWGGGGLTTGIASGLHAVSPDTKIYVCEPDTGAPVTAAIANDRRPTPVEFTPSFVDGAGSGALIQVMWEHARDLIAGSCAVSLEDTAAAVRLLLERARIVAEGAAALTVAAALSGRVEADRIVCIISGGNIDATRLAEILAGRVPS